MKNLKYIILSLCVIGMASCDLLENDSKSAMNDEIVFSSTQSAEQAIAGIYEVFGEQNAYRTRLVGGWVGLNTDIEISSKNAPYTMYEMNVMGHSDLVMKDKNPWAYLTAIIERTNLCIKGIDDALASRKAANDSVKGEELVHFNYLKGEAICLRSFAYYEILKLWGDAPYNFEPVDILDPNSIYKPVAPRVEIFQRLREDLKLAAELMPWSEGCPGGAKNFTGRPSKAFALGLRARINLMYAGKGLQRETNTVDYNTKDDALRAELYQEVADDCSMILANLNEKSKILDDYEQVFRNICQGVTDYSQSEVIWEIPFLDGVRGQLLNRCGLRVNKDNGNAFGKVKNTTLSNSSNGMVGVTMKLVDLFAQSAKRDNKSGFYTSYADQTYDKRYTVTICPYQWQYRNDKCGEVFGETDSSSLKRYLLAKFKTDPGKMYLGKYRFEWLNGAYTGEDDGLNLPIMRMSEVALMLAEALLEEGVTSASYTADDAFNLVHARATGGITVPGVTIDDIKRERALEFAGENLRKYDLIRWGEFGKTMNEARVFLETKASSSYNPDQQQATFVWFQDDSFSADPSKWPAYDCVWAFHKKDGHSILSTEVVKGLGITEVGRKNKTGWGSNALKSTKFYGCKDEEIEHRQYWPFFNVITNANPQLQNAYGY